MKKTKDLTGQRFNKLLVLCPAETIIEASGTRRSASKCICDCGNIIIIRNEKLKSNHTKSCGCFKLEKIKETNKLFPLKNVKYHPMIASARNLFISNYSDGNLSYDDFFNLSSKNCFYCDAIPSNIYNVFDKKTKSYTYGSNEGNFIYNGLDRINSKLGHNKNNVVTCCWNCNRSKCNKSLDEFKLYINKLISHSIINIDDHRKLSLYIDYSILNNKDKSAYRSSVKYIFHKHNKSYADGNLTMEQFYQLSQLNCYYCNSEPMNNCNHATHRNSYSQFAKDTGNFNYNGLDRINSNLKHTYENVVACCKICNMAKNKTHFNDFISWIARIRNNFPKWKNFSSLIIVEENVI